MSVVRTLDAAVRRRRGERVAGQPVPGPADETAPADRRASIAGAFPSTAIPATIPGSPGTPEQR